MSVPPLQQPAPGLARVRLAWGDKLALKFGKPLDLRQLNRDAAWRQGIAADQARLSARFAARSALRAACPLCGEGRALEVLSVHSVGYMECAGCTHIYSRLAPAQDAVQALYDAPCGTAAASSQSRIYLDESLFLRRTALIGRPKVDFVTSVVGSARGEWLDVGCGTGEVLAAARDAGWLARGIEADGQFVEFAQAHGLAVERAFVTAHSSASLMREARIVSLFNVVEHVEDPVALLRAIAAGVRPGTWLVVEVPRHPSVSSLSNLLFPQMSARHICPPDHLHVFTDASLAGLLRQAGVQPRALWLFGQDYQDLVMTGLSSQLGDRPAPAFVDAILDAAPALQQAIDEAGLSDTVLMVGRFGDGS